MVSRYVQIGLGASLIVVGGIQSNAQLFGAKWSGIVLTGSGIALAVIVYVQAQVAKPADPPK